MERGEDRPNLRIIEGGMRSIIEPRTQRDIQQGLEESRGKPPQSHLGKFEDPDPDPGPAAA